MTFVIRSKDDRNKEIPGSALIAELNRGRVRLSVDKEYISTVRGLAPFFSVATVEGKDNGEIICSIRQRTGSNTGLTKCYLFPHEAQVTVHSRRKPRGR